LKFLNLRSNFSGETLLNIIKKYGLVRPFVFIEEEKAKKNITMMADKAARHGVRFRPHFKTHRSGAIGEWFRENDVKKITVSSVGMASYFAERGWNDILIAFPVNTHEISRISTLASANEISLIVDNKKTVQTLEENLGNPVNLMIKINTGYNRAGIYYEDFDLIVELANLIERSEKLNLTGIITHNGETYTNKGKNAIIKSYEKSLEIMNDIKNKLSQKIGKKVILSIGNTPACKLAENFEGVDEIRPGNFVFYDWMQYRYDVCEIDEIAVYMVAPVVSVLSNPGRIVVYGGGVHLSKDGVVYDGNVEYGAAVIRGEKFPVGRISQEHGVIEMENISKYKIEPGDWIKIIPAHSCLMLDMFKDYYTSTGLKISAMGKYFGD